MFADSLSYVLALPLAFAPGFNTPGEFYETVSKIVLPPVIAFATACLSVVLAGLVIRAFGKS